MKKNLVLTGLVAVSLSAKAGWVQITNTTSSTFTIADFTVKTTFTPSAVAYPFKSLTIPPFSSVFYPSCEDMVIAATGSGSSYSFTPGNSNLAHLRMLINPSVLGFDVADTWPTSIAGVHHATYSQTGPNRDVTITITP